MPPLLLLRQLLDFVLVRALVQHAGLDDLAAQAQPVRDVQVSIDLAGKSQSLTSY